MADLETVLAKAKYAALPLPREKSGPTTIFTFHDGQLMIVRDRGTCLPDLSGVNSKRTWYLPILFVAEVLSFHNVCSLNNLGRVFFLPSLVAYATVASAKHKFVSMSPYDRDIWGRPVKPQFCQPVSVLPHQDCVNNRLNDNFLLHIKVGASPLRTEISRRDRTYSSLLGEIVLASLRTKSELVTRFLEEFYGYACTPPPN